MKSPKEMSESLFRGGDTLAKRVSICRRLASGIATVSAENLGLTDKERETLAKARVLLSEIGSAYGKAAKLKKAVELRLEQRHKDVRAAMKSTFDALLVTTADKVALIAANHSYTFRVGGIGHDFSKPGDVEYLMGPFFEQCLADVAYGIASSTAADVRDLPPAGAAALVWQRFLDRRAQLQDKYAHVIVRVDRTLGVAGTAGGATCS